MSVDAKTQLAPRLGQLKPGTRLNNIYEIESLIAVGGMGEVYRGKTLQTGDAVALKILRAEFAHNEAAMGLFRKEASTLHRFAHDAIVRYYLFSYDEQIGHAYLAMEFVDGLPLSDMLRGGEVLTPQQVDVLRVRLATALAEAHEFGVVHRDLSPDNVILPGNDVRKSKIIDFGIVRSLDPKDQTLIGSGFAGKYNYVSPEQLGLYGGDVGPQSDIYSLGLLLACALRGKPLAMEGTNVETIERRRTVPDLNTVDAHFRPLLAAMLEPDPARRIKSMREVADWELGLPEKRGGNMMTRGGKRGGAKGLASTPKASPKGPNKVVMVASIAAVAAVLGIGVALFAIRGEDSWPGDVVWPRDTATEKPPTPPEKTTEPDKPKGVDTEPDRPGGTGPETTPVEPGDGRMIILPADLQLTPRLRDMLDYIDGSNKRESCFYASVGEIADNRLIAYVFGDDQRAIQAFHDGFKSRFFEPFVNGHAITDAQCPAADFLSLGPSTSPIGLVVDADKLINGDVLSTEVLNAEGLSTQYLLVTEEGDVFSLGQWASPNGSRLSAPIELLGKASAAPAILIAISYKTDSEPVALVSGAPKASDFFPKLRDTLAASRTPVAIKPAFIKFLPQ